MSRKEIKIGDLIACKDGTQEYTIGWITRIVDKFYIVQWADDKEEFWAKYILNDIKDFKACYNELANSPNND